MEGKDNTLIDNSRENNKLKKGKSFSTSQFNKNGHHNEESPGELSLK